jgi:hypothetical protein
MQTTVHALPLNSRDHIAIAGGRYRMRTPETLLVEKRWGDKAGVHIAKRVTSLAMVGDEAGVERCIAIATI